MEKKFNKNEQIRAPEVLLVGVEGAKPELMSLESALSRAYDQDLDLVEIGPNQTPPVCKAMDFGAYLYQESKKRHESQKSGRERELKEMRLRPATDEGDFATKSRQLKEFLESGHKVKLSIRFRGREIAFSKQGFAQIERMRESVGEAGKLESPPRMDGRQIVCLFAPEAKSPKR